MRILYVEDDPRSAAMVGNSSAPPAMLVWEDNGSAALLRAGMEPFDVIILDRMLGDIDGLTITRRLREGGIGTPILILSALGRSSDRADGLDGGADDYLAKPFEPEELVARLRALHRRATGREHSAVILYGAFECHVKARTAFRDNRHLALSPKEFELFRYFMENAGEVVTREMLLRHVWKMDFDPQTNVVDVNIGRLRRKLEDGFDRPALETILGSGYRLLDGEAVIEARRSIFSRLVAGAIVLSLVLLAGLWWLTHQTVSTTLQEAARAEVDVDLAGLADIYATGGKAELQARIADRIALTPMEGGASHYLLADDRGRRIAGDLAEWPSLDPAVSESGIITIGANSRGFARAVQLGPDLRLVVARGIDIEAPVLSSIAMAFAAGGAVFIALVALLGRFAALGLQRRIGRINLAFREPQDGAGLAAAGRADGDEIDELTAHSGAALARVNDLLAAYKDTSEQLAHEIRTPLSHLDNRLVKALAEKPDPAIAEKLAEARGEIRRIVQTLESLLDIAASKANRGDRSGLAPVDLSALVTGICELYAGSAEEAGLELGWTVAPGVTINGDERQLGRLVTNMLDNALKYVPPGGHIAITLEPGPVLVVADDGPGVDPQDRERIFDRFYRGRGKGEETSGSGLGLALARAIAERHALALTLEEPAAGGPGGAVFRIAAAT